MTAYVLALTIITISFLVNIVCCIIDFRDFRKLKERVKALEEKNK